MADRARTVEDRIDQIRQEAAGDLQKQVRILEQEFRDVMLFGPPWRRTPGHPWSPPRTET